MGVVSRRHEAAEPPGGKPSGEKEAASELWTRPLTWLPARAWPPTSPPRFPRSRTRTWCSGWSRSSWSWSARATSSSSPTRLSCAASWPTSWTRAQVPWRGVGRLDLGWHWDTWQPDLPPCTETGVHSSVGSAGLPAASGPTPLLVQKPPVERGCCWGSVLLGWRGSIELTGLAAVEKWLDIPGVLLELQGGWCLRSIFILGIRGRQVSGVAVRKCSSVFFGTPLPSLPDLPTLLRSLHTGLWCTHLSPSLPFVGPLDTALTPVLLQGRICSGLISFLRHPVVWVAFLAAVLIIIGFRGGVVQLRSG